MIKNPYRTGSKMHTIFGFLSTGQEWSLRAITGVAYGPSGWDKPIYRKRVASALRTIRKRSDVSIEFNGSAYRMTEVADA